MPIFFSIVARGPVVLAEYASYSGNFTEVADQILSKIPPDDDKVTYSHGNYLFHYISEKKLIYFCITDDQFPLSRAFLFLNEVKKRFTPANSEFVNVLATIMEQYSEPKDLGKISKLHENLEELNKIMKINIDRLVERGTKLDYIIVQADMLASRSVPYSNNSRSLKKKMFWKNVQMYIILALVATLAVYLIGAISCGGLTWKKCIG